MKGMNWQGFLNGVGVGAVTATLLGIGTLYVLNMANWIVVAPPPMQELQVLLNWAYDNLRLSAIPFALTLVLYAHSLRRLKRLLAAREAQPERVAQADHMVDIWTNLFFGIGVIWTAIGIRSALLTAIGNLDPGTAAELGAFSILQRLVDGGILLALSTTIFGAVGGYLLRLLKAMVVGVQLQAYYGEFSKHQTDEIGRTLLNIERHLAVLVNVANGRPGAERSAE
ncbi:MAG: hypothetical protein QNJ87_01280 [Gammaproteobacteria bacterium]|nr:hypothetical protein [Gammaproteobacteria bacterium]